MVKLFGKAHKVVYRMSGGRVFAKLGRAPMLLLTATGRKSGKPRTTPLLYIEDGDGFAVVASFGGAPEHPSWYRNLEKDPEVTLQIKNRVISVTASTATPEEKKRLWPRLTAIYPDYDTYQKETTRDIPVVLLRQ
jgi:deazaflavin-dependent oxidoreductase (nitroreductase family)